MPSSVARHPRRGRQEGIALPDALAGEGNLTLEVGAGRLPVVQALSVSLMSLPVHMVFQRTAPPLLASMAAAAALGPYPRVDDALNAAVAQLNRAAAELKGNADRIPNHAADATGSPTTREACARLSTRLLLDSY